MTEWRIRGGKSESVNLLHFMFVSESQDESAVAGGFPPLPRKLNSSNFVHLVEKEKQVHNE